MNDLYITTNQNTREHMLFNHLISGYNLPPIAAQALVELSKSIFASGDKDYNNFKPGQIKYFAVSIEEPPGKPIRECNLVPVVLTLDSQDDMEHYQKYGLIECRRNVIRRICDESYTQQAPLSMKDLVRILKVSYSTVKRDIKVLNEYHLVPTRGVVKDIGPSSHKCRILEFYLQWYTPTEIEKKMLHSLTSVERYIKDFARVAILTKRCESIDNIRLIVGISERLVKEYQALYEKYRKIHRERIEEITATIQVHEKAATYKKTEKVI